ncbi:ATP-binding cassette domain-containing protein [bacterium]|nr:ATP-binding cassette domain-containing protein [bacterium]
MPKPLVEVKDVKKWFPVRRGLLRSSVEHVHAVDGVTFCIEKGEVLGLVGESGCGKSTLGRILLHLLLPTSGSVMFDGQEVSALRRKNLRQLRKNMQMVFQDPYSSLNPRMTVGSVLREVLHVHELADREEMPARIDALLEMVGLNSFHARRYPHEFSSGQRQRIGIARALAVEPQFLVCDEPVSALDVSIQAQILNLLQDLKDALNLTYLFISHDLAVVRHIADRIAVMYLGRLVEIGNVEDVLHHSKHPYTEALLSAAPHPDPDYHRRTPLIGSDVPSPINMPSGCPFHTRCPEVFDDCRHTVPQLGNLPGGQRVACLKYACSRPSATAHAASANEISTT